VQLAFNFSTFGCIAVGILVLVLWAFLADANGWASLAAGLAVAIAAATWTRLLDA
jgi:hypothetical protein